MKNIIVLRLIIAVMLTVLISAAMYYFRSDSRQRQTQDFKSLVEAGQLYFRIGEYTGALKLFREAELAAKKEKNITEQSYARYLIATTHWLRSPDPEPALATKEFKALLNDDPLGEYAPWCKLAMVRMQHLVDPSKQPDYDKILKEYLDIYNQYPDNIAGQEALLYRVATLLSLFDDENATKQARDEIVAFLHKHPESTYISSFWGQLSTAENVLGNNEQSLSSRIKSLETSEIDPTNPRQDNSNNYWYIATYAEYTVGDFAIARKYYELLQSEYPRDRRNFAALRALERMKKMEADIRAGKMPAPEASAKIQLPAAAAPAQPKPTEAVTQ